MTGLKKFTRRSALFTAATLGLFVLAALLIRNFRANDSFIFSLASETDASASPVVTSEFDSEVHIEVSDYGNTRHVVTDRAGGLILSYVDVTATGRPAIVLGHSADKVTWRVYCDEFGPDTMRPALAYDPINDKLHMLYHANGTDERSDVRYRRYSIRRGNDGHIQRVSVEGDLLLQSNNGSRGTLMWTPDGGRHGAVIAAWTAFDGRSVRDVRVSMRSLNNSREDFAVESWEAPGGSVRKNDGVAGARVAIDIIDTESSLPVPRSYEGRFFRLGLATLVQRRGGSGPHDRDLYVIYSLIGGPATEWKWSKASWNPDSAKWDKDGGWDNPIGVQAGHFDEGRVEKELTLSALYDEVSDTIWFAAAHFVPASAAEAAHDMISLFGIDSGDDLLPPTEIYGAPGSSSRHPMTSVSLDVRDGRSTIYVAFVTGDEKRADGEIWLRAFTPAEGFGAPQTIFDQIPSNYPNFTDRITGGRLYGIFRVNLESPSVRFAAIDVSGATTDSESSFKELPSEQPE